MTKKKWISLGIIAVCAVIVLTIFSVLFERSTGVALPWWAYIVGLLIYALIVYLIYLITKISSQRYDTMLAKANFHADRQYSWNKQILSLDFESKRLANTYLTTKPFVPFSDVVSYRFETYQSGFSKDLSEDKRFVSLVLSVKKEGLEQEFLYIPVFEIEVDTEVIGDGITEITSELVEKYPALSDMAELQSDVKRILEINAVDGITPKTRKW